MKTPPKKTEGHSIQEIELSPEDRQTLLAMAKRYQAKDLVDFLKGVVLKEQGPDVIARFYDEEH